MCTFFDRWVLACCSELFYKHFDFRTAQNCMLSVKLSMWSLKTHITSNATFPKSFFIISLFIGDFFFISWNIQDDKKITILFLFKVSDFNYLKSYAFFCFILDIPNFLKSLKLKSIPLHLQVQLELSKSVSIYSWEFILWRVD